MAIALMSPDPDFDARVRAVADGVERRWSDAHLAADAGEVAAAAAAGGVGTVVLGPGLPVDVLLGVARALDLGHPHVAVVVVADPTPHLLREALLVGVRDVVPPDADAEALGRSLRRAAEASSRLRALAGGEVGAPPASRVFSVLSPKGGSGKTTVSTNLAVALARWRPGEVAIVDLDVQFGDVPTALQIEPEQTLRDVARSPVPVDPTMLKLLLQRHASGLHVLAGPTNPVDAGDLTAAQSAHVLALLAGELPWVVVDTAAGLDEHALVAIDAATDLVFVCSLDITSVRSLRKELDALDELGIVGARRHLVLNRADSRVGIDAGDVEAVVGLPVDVVLPSSRAIPVSMNQGSPVVESDPRSPVAKQLQAFADRLAGRDEPVAAGAVPTRRRWRDGR